MLITEAREAYNQAVERMNTAADAIQAAGTDADLDKLEAAFDAAKADVERSRRQLDKVESIAEARQAFPILDAPTAAEQSQTGKLAAAAASPAARSITTGTQPSPYRPDQPEVSFFRDLVMSKSGNRDALDRLHANNLSQRAASTTITTSDGGFIPPGYLGELYAQLPRAGRPFANNLPTIPLPTTGMSFAVPRVTTAATAAVQATENNAVSNTDQVSTQLAVPVVTIGGYNDVSLQLFSRSEPGIDMILFQDLRMAYDAATDTQLLSGTGSNGQHLGIRGVTSINTVTYSTDGSDTAAEALPYIYKAIAAVHQNRYLPPTHIIMHPRRAAWLAAGLSSTFPLFQQGTLYQAAGQQDLGLVGSIAGIPVIADANIGTTYGTSTNEDEIYVCHVPDLYFAEGNLQADVFNDVGSANLTVRLRLFAYQAFVSGRQPKSITKLSGSALATTL